MLKSLRIFQNCNPVISSIAHNAFKTIQFKQNAKGITQLVACSKISLQL